MDSDYEKRLTTPSADGPQFKPAKGYLIVMGFFVLLGGLLFFGLGWLYAFKMPELMGMAGADFAGESLNTFMISLGACLGAIGLGVVILGIGSIALRRWARDLLYATGWLLVGFAALMTVAMLMSIPHIMSLTETLGMSSGGSGPGKSESMIMIVGFAIGMLFYLLVVGIPGVLLILVYRSKNVELTTKYYDQSPAWTGKCHVTVLTLWLFLILAIVTVATMFFGYGKLLTTMGVVPSAMVGNLVLGAILVILTILTFGVSKSAPWAWWGTLGYLIACVFISAWVFNTADMESMYSLFLPGVGGDDSSTNEALQNYSKANIQTSFYTGLFTLFALVGYLFMIRKHFFGGDSAETERPA